MNKRLSTRKVILVIVLVLVAAVLAFGAYFYTHMKASDAQAKETISSLEYMIPGLDSAEDTDPAQGFTPGKDPLTAFDIDGRQIVGCLEIPALDLRAPVLDKKQEKEAFFVSWISGSPVRGKFRLEGANTDVFAKIAKLKPGERVIFTDMDGVRYVYEVTTQYHLKDWAQATNDLLLCHPSDDQTDFVVGCTSVM